MNKRIMLIMTAGILLALLCAAGCAPAAGTAQPEATQAPAPEKVVEETPILRVSIAQAPLPANLIDRQSNLLYDLFKESSSQLADAGFPVQIEQGIPRTMAGLYGCQTLFLPPIGEFDLYLMDSSLTLQAQKEQGFYPVPGDILDKNGRPAYAIERGFTDASGQVFGLPAATTPVMLIYNPEMLGVLPEPVTIEMIVDYADKFPIWVPEHGGIGVALTHSLLGDDFTPDLFYDKGMYERFGEYEGLYERYRSLGAGRSASTEEIVNGFYNQEIAWTVHSSAFLALLAQRDYQGAVAVAPFPVVKEQGGSAIAWAWVVPTESKYPDLAWKVAGQLMESPAMQRWFLLNGVLPVRAVEFERLFEDPELKGLLPAYMLNNQVESLKQLERIASLSPAWQVPANVPIDFYNEKILIEGDRLAAQIVNGTYSPSQAGEIFFSLVQQIMP